jgi:pantoate--beta-alanine ligase
MATWFQTTARIDAAEPDSGFRAQSERHRGRIGGHMEQIVHIAALRDKLAEARRSGKTIGFVPTMGAFHDGHLTLMRRARAECDVVVASLFINPTQFNDARDFERYPRDEARDAALAAEAGVDWLFVPSPAEMYPDGFDTVVAVRGLSDRLEGASRPGHFNGVATVVAKLLNIAQADRAYFGEKDWQQLQVIKRMTADLNIPTEIIGVPTVREPDGLAMSSRNVLLTSEQRKAATVLSHALSEVEQATRSGTLDAGQLAARLGRTISGEPLAQLDYAKIVEPNTLVETDTVENGGLAVVAAKFGNVRLIDNRLLSIPEGATVRR